MSDIKLDDAQIDVLLSDLFQCGFNVTAKQVQSLAREVKELRKALVQRDAQIAALKADFISLDKQMSVLEQTGITDRDRADKAEAQLAELAKQEPVAWVFKSQLDWLDHHRYLQADLFSQQRFDEVPLYTRAAPPAPVVPDGWEACSPEWIDRNGPCSCANAPRLAFGSVGQHYHPHIFIDNTAQQYEALAKESDND